jgi:hypothetical protein
MDERNSADRPRWLTDDVLEGALRVLHLTSASDFGEAEAVDLLVRLGQIMEVMGTLDLEVKSEDK